MNVTINILQSRLDEIGLTNEHFHEAVGNALSQLECPVSGNPIYFNGVQVTVIADCPELVPA